MKLPSEMSQDEWFRCIDLHFDSTATLAKSIALLQVIADDVGREEPDRNEAAAEATEAQRQLGLQDARWKMVRLGEQGLNPPSPEQVKTAHALSQKVAKVNAATAAVAAVVTISKAVANALERFNGNAPAAEG
jgi:hypothetical protein